MSIVKKCKECGEEFETYLSKIKSGGGKFCSTSCSTTYHQRRRLREKIEKAKENPLSWNVEIAYLTGLITADGSLRRDKPVIQFSNKDLDLIEQVREIAENQLDINRSPLYKKEKNGYTWWKYTFTSRRFYYFLKEIGIMPNKSRIIRKIDIPVEVFWDWLRGEIDGDGCWYVSKKGNLSLQITSGSRHFLDWVYQVVDDNTSIKGKESLYHTKKNTYRLDFYQNDSIKIAKKIYSEAQYFLKRKFNIVNQFKSEEI